MVSNPTRFLVLLCHVVRAREKPIVSSLPDTDRTSKSPRRASRRLPTAPPACGRRTLDFSFRRLIVSLLPPARQRVRRDDVDGPTLDLSKTTDALACHVVPSPVTAPVQSPPPVPKVTGDCLPLELLCAIFDDFSLAELLPLRLVSKTWLAAANSQSAYSRNIDYCYGGNFVATGFQEDSKRVSIDMLKSRLDCSSRAVKLRIAGAGVDKSAHGEELLSVISQHLHRTEVLWIKVHPDMAASTSHVLRQPAPVLCDFSLDIGFRATARIEPDIFLGNAPVLHSLSLYNCAIESSAGYAAFGHVRRLKIQARSPDCVGLGRMFRLCPRLEQLDISAFCHSEDSFPPRDIDIVAAPRLGAVRVELPSDDDLLYVVEALTGPTTSLVSLSIPSYEASVMMFSQLRGLGPFIFTVDNEQSTKLHTMHVRVCSVSTTHIREIEIHENEHWEWPGDFNDSFLLDILEASSLAPQIEAVHVTIQPEGYSSLSFLSAMQGVWPAVHTVRIDIHAPPRAPRVSSGFPELQQVVLYYPQLSAEALSSEMEDICSKFLNFFRFSTRCMMDVVLTRDLQTADIVARDPQAAMDNPLCSIWSWMKVKVEEVE